jgi:3-dehydroquinate synthase class II
MGVIIWEEILCDFSGRERDQTVAICHSGRRVMRAIKNELDGEEQSTTIQNKTIDRIMSWYRSQYTDTCVFTEKE